MAFMFVLGACIGCGKTFSFNPDLVPAVPANVSPTGEKEPVCQNCVDIANPKRIANGLEPIHVLPGAYDPVEVP